MSDACEDTLVWLSERWAGVPTQLREAIRSAVMRVEDAHDSPGDVLRAAADLLLTEAVRPQSESDPTTLLAADALITYVCEYRSEMDPGLLQTLQ